MVRDITLDIKERDLLFTDKSNANLPVFDSVWGDIFDEDKANDVLICNIIIPEAYWPTIAYKNNEFVCRFKSAYVPDTRGFRVRLLAVKDGAYNLFSSIRGDFGIPVTSYAISKNIATPISACMLPHIDINGHFMVRLLQNPRSEMLDRAYIYSSKTTDLLVDYSDDQASQLLSLCAPGNSYRYPTTGVGITRYLNSVIAHTDLKTNLETQFLADNKPLLSADFDSETCKLDVLCNPERTVEDADLEKIENLNFGFFNAFTDDYVRRNIVLTDLSDTNFIELLNNFNKVLNIIFFLDSTATVHRIADKVEGGRLDGEGNIIPSDDWFVVSATLKANSIVMFDDEEEDTLNDSPVFIINDHDETRLYTSLVGQPYWITDRCHKCLILKKRATIKYMIRNSRFSEGKGLYLVLPTSANLKNLLGIVQDENTGAIFGVVSDSTNISDMTLEEITQHIYASQIME